MSATDENVSAPIEEPKKDPFTIVQADIDLLIELRKTKKELLELKKKISTGEVVLPFPFESKEVLETAKRLLLAHMQVEIDLCTMVGDVLDANRALKEKVGGKHGDDVFANVASFTVWLNHVTKLHATHCEQIFATSPRFVQNVSDEREELVRKTAKEACRCTVHKEKTAIAKSIDGQTLYCSECVKQQQLE